MRREEMSKVSEERGRMLVDIHGKRKKGEETRDSIRAQGDGEEPGVSPFPASAPPTQGPVQCPAMCFVARTLPPFSSNWNETPLEMTNCMRAEAQSCTTEKASSLCVVMQCIQSWFVVTGGRTGPRPCRTVWWY